MPKTKQVPSLDLNGSQTVTSIDGRVPPSPSTMSPTSPRSPRSPREHTIRPVMGREKSSDEHTNGDDQQTIVRSPTSPTITAIPQFPPSPRSPPKHGRDPSKSFFSNLMASKSSHRLNSPDRNTESPVEKEPKSRTSSKERSLYSRHVRGSTTDLTKMNHSNETSNDSEVTVQDEDPETQSISQDVPSDSTPSLLSSSRNRRQKFGGLLQRTRSTRVEDAPRTTRLQAPQRLNLERQNSDKTNEFQEPLKTAPVRAVGRSERERAFKDAVTSPGRTRSADRQESDSTDRLAVPNRREKSNLSSSLREGAGAQLLSNLSQTGKGAADRLGRAGKGFFGKIARSGSSNEREVILEDNYHCTTITLPLVPQTRRTRIAKRLELSKDKTEFWMPALPWRCIE